MIIPLYNTEKYISECLDSLLAQTLTDFEVVVVDDCSTDSSCVIVESYRERFGGRLTLSHMETNTGSGALPRNKGLMLSRGEYVFFMDADDLLSLTALEEDYNLARKYNADVVHHVRYCSMKPGDKQIRLRELRHKDLTDAPNFESEDLNERTEKILYDTVGIEPWTNLVRRNLLIENGISFYSVRYAEDYFWSYLLLLNAKKWLRVPNVVYLHRELENSMTRKERTAQQKIEFWLNPLINGLACFERDLQRLEFFRHNPDILYVVLERFVRGHFNALFAGICQTLPAPSVFYETLKHEFGDKLGDNDVLICALCTYIHGQQKAFTDNVQQFNQFAAQAQEQVNKFNQFAAAAQARIAELEAEVKRLQS